MKKFFLALTALYFALLAPPLAANPDLLDQVRELTLSNGMKFLLLRRPGAPVFTGYIQVKVGGIDEAEGQTGIAHLLEHMAFKGTSEIGTSDFAAEQRLLEELETVHAELRKAQGPRRVALAKRLEGLVAKAGSLVVKEEFSKIYLRNGGADLNATTSQDLTSYFVQLPNTKLRLWAYLESSRLRDPVFREFYTERDVVQEERRTRIDDSPFGKLYESLMALAFDKSPYRRPTIGYPADLQRLSADDLKVFYKKYYVPGNMVGTLVGDIDPGEATKVLEEYFGKIPAGPAPPKVEAREPEPQQEKRVEVPFDASPALMAGYLKPTMPHPDDYVFDILDQVLCEGRTSRLYKRLVVQDRLVQNVACSASSPGSRLDNLFFIYASILPEHDADEVLKAVDDELGKVLREGVGSEELKKAKKNLLAAWNYELQSNDEAAQLLSYFEALAGGWRYVLEHPKRIQAVSSQDLQRVTRQYLKPERRRTAILKPTKKS
ncbi:MAG: insulinase family protein [Deltaproteobacteria bacterium]|nr:insulinase family protein [Deltaproteobacteria bacterium]